MLSIIEKVYRLVIDDVKNELINLFENGIFNINIAINLVTILKTTMIYENSSTLEIKFKNEEEEGEEEEEGGEEDEGEEYFIYNIKRIFDSLEFKELFNKNKVFDLQLKIIENDNTFDIVYDQCIIIPLPYINNMPNELIDEYIETYNLFSNLFLTNHKRALELNDKLKISLSLNGKIYNRPDREYYIVIESSNIYNVHVYKLDINSKREKQLFILWVDKINGIIRPLINN